jgi:Putative effector of murein hydrolase
VGIVIVGGFYFTLFSTALSVLAIRGRSAGAGATMTTTNTSSSSSSFQDASVVIKDATTLQQSSPATAAVATKAFSDRTFSGLVTAAVTSMVFAMIGTLKKSNLPSPAVAATTPLQATAFLFTTLATFAFGARLPKSFTQKVHPLITCTTLTWTVMAMFAKLTGQTFSAMLSSYRVGSMCPIHLGAGDLLLFMLGPAVVALACQMYNRKRLMKENLWEVGTAVGVSSVGGLFGTAAMVRLLGLSSPVLRLCCLSRNITSPLAMAIAGILGADVSLAVSMVVVTGLLGANFGASILDKAGIKDPVARGMGIGAAAHGLGTAAFTEEKDAFPFAAISMALTASACTVLVSIPFVKKLVLSLALGGSS